MTLLALNSCPVSPSKVRAHSCNSLSSTTYPMDEAGRALLAKLSTSLAAVHDVLLRSTGQVANKSVHDFVADESLLGPVLVACGLTDGKGGMHALPELSYGGWPADGGGVAVGIRSLSKMVAAATYLMLVERGEGGLALDSRLGVVVPECSGSSLASTTAVDAMSMRSPLDNRLSAAWGASQGMADHASFPPECDGLGLGALECVVQVVCPRYGDAEPEAITAGRMHCRDRGAGCNAWAAIGECDANPNFMHRECEASCGQCSTEGPPLQAAQLRGRAWWGFTSNSCEDRDFTVCEASQAAPQRQLELRQAQLCRYDNYAYTLLDAMVRRGARGARGASVKLNSPEPGPDTETDTKTDTDTDTDTTGLSPGSSTRSGSRSPQTCRRPRPDPCPGSEQVQRRTGLPLWRWSLQLIAAPLAMQGTLRCMQGGGGEGNGGERGQKGGGGERGSDGGGGGGGEEGVAACFGPPPTPHETLRPDAWRRWRGGVETTAWASSNGTPTTNPNPNPTLNLTLTLTHSTDPSPAAGWGGG